MFIHITPQLQYYNLQVLLFNHKVSFTVAYTVTMYKLSLSPCWKVGKGSFYSSNSSIGNKQECYDVIRVEAIRPRAETQIEGS